MQVHVNKNTKHIIYGIFLEQKQKLSETLYISCNLHCKLDDINLLNLPNIVKIVHVDD